MTDFEEETREKLLTDLENAGQLFPGYQLNRENGRLKLLGKGGFSSVYEMHAIKAQGADGESRAYALKVIGMERHTVSEEHFEDTCRLQRKLAEQSPYIMRLLDIRELSVAGDGTETAQAAEDPGFLLQLILMERADSILEKDKFRNVRLLREDLEEEAGVLQFALQIGEAIQTAHRNRILHRDIKLENIFWNEADQVYQLGDFGIAKFVERGRAETLAYTDGYGAPEIERRLADHYNATADIYSFGITLYLLLNDLKFPGSDCYRMNSVQYDPEFVFPAPEHASEQMAGIIRKMCGFYPEDRYQSMEEVLRELRLAEAGEKGTEASPEDSEELLEDRPTVTYHDDGSEEEQELRQGKGTGRNADAGGGETRMDRILREKSYKAVFHTEAQKYFVCFSVLFLLILSGTEKHADFATDWRFFLLPAAVIVEAVLLQVKDFHKVFGVIAFGFWVYSATVIGSAEGWITVPHLVLLLCLAAGVPVVSAAGGMAVLLWMFSGMTMPVPILSSVLDLLTWKWLCWLWPVLLFICMNDLFQLGKLVGEIAPLRIWLWNWFYFLLPFLSVLSGAALWIRQWTKGGETPGLMQGLGSLYLILFGVGLLVGKRLHER